MKTFDKKTLLLIEEYLESLDDNLNKIIRKNMLHLENEIKYVVYFLEQERLNLGFVLKRLQEHRKLLDNLSK